VKVIAKTSVQKIGKSTALFINVYTTNNSNQNLKLKLNEVTAVLVWM
jgi:hypothetical protein